MFKVARDGMLVDGHEFKAGDSLEIPIIEDMDGNTAIDEALCLFE